MSAGSDSTPGAERPARDGDGEHKRNDGQRPRRLARGAYLLPSLFTMGNMLLGFYAVVSGYRGDFHKAALLVFAAAVLDMLDGRIARLTNTTSDFGREFDSLADLFTFGVVPALLTFLWSGDSFGRIGWLVAFYYLVCTATRLARYNVQVRVVDSRWFVGLPSPAAAGALCSLFVFEHVLARDLAAADSWALALGDAARWQAWITVALFLSLGALGTLEVTTFRYASFKRIDLRRRWSYRAALPLALAVLVVAWEPGAFFLVLASLYAASGPVGWLIERLGRRALDETSPSLPHPTPRDPDLVELEES